MSALPPAGRLDESLGLARLDGLVSPPQVQTYWQLRILAFIAVFALGAMLAGLVWVPWQQSVVGKGQVIVLSPMQRPQNLEAPIKARISRWHVQEGQVVTEGELIAELAEVDTAYLDVRQTQRLKTQQVALADQLAASVSKVDALVKQGEALVKYRDAAIASAAEKMRQAAQKLKQEQAVAEAERQNVETARQNRDRIGGLRAKGIRSQRDVELAELSMVKARTGLQKAEAAVELARRAQEVARLERAKVDLEVGAKISSIDAYVAEAREKVAKTEGEIQKLDTKLASLEARVELREVKAPMTGRVVRLLKVGAGETVKPGDVLAVLAPATTDRAVELFISGQDAPLVNPGRHVRLQFAGWPALQFSGWPQVAVGTFGGRVQVVDAVDDGKGRFRILVIPEDNPPTGGEAVPWPEAGYLRPGAKVAGWVMLDEVSLGFELWRQFNGFAPTLDEKPKDPHGPEKIKAAKRK